MKETMNMMLNNLEKLESKQHSKDNFKSNLVSRNCHINPYNKSINIRKIETAQTNQSKGKISNNYTRENTSIITKINTPYIVTTKTSQNISKTNTTINSPIAEKNRVLKNLKHTPPPFGLETYVSLSKNSNNKRQTLENFSLEIYKSPFKVKRIPTKSELLLYGRNRNISNSLSHISSLQSKGEKCYSRLSSSSNLKGSKKKLVNQTQNKLKSSPNTSKSVCLFPKKDKIADSTIHKNKKEINTKSTNLPKMETRIINIKISTKNGQKNKKNTSEVIQNSKVFKQKDRDSKTNANNSINETLKLFSKKPSRQGITKENEDTKNKQLSSIYEELSKKNTSNFVPRVLTSLYEDYNNNYDSDHQISSNKRKHLIRKLSEARKSKKIENQSSNSSSKNNIQIEDMKNIFMEFDELKNVNQLNKGINDSKEEMGESGLNQEKSIQISSYSMTLQKKDMTNNTLMVSSKGEIEYSNCNQINFPENINMFFYNSTKSNENFQLLYPKFLIKGRGNNLNTKSSKATISLSEIVNEVEIELLGTNNTESSLSRTITTNKKSTFRSLKVLRMNKKFCTSKEKEINIVK